MLPFPQDDLTHLEFIEKVVAQTCLRCPFLPAGGGDLAGPPT